MKKATSKSSLKAMAWKVVAPASEREVGRGVLGRVPWAWSWIWFRASEGISMFGNPLARGNLNGTTPLEPLFDEPCP